MENHANYVVAKTHWSKWNKLDKGVFFWVKFVLLFMTHIYCLIDYTLIIIFTMGNMKFTFASGEVYSQTCL
jgi:hypothetical protein